MNSLNIEITGEGPPLILLHGWGWHSGVFRPLVAELAEKYQLFLIDLPGFGKSPLITSHYTLAEITECILSQIPQDAVWMGWSLGGLLAMYAAIYHSHRVRGLVTISSSPKFISESDWPGMTKEALEVFSAALQKDPAKTLREFLQLQLRGSPQASRLYSQLENEIQVSHPEALLGGLRLLAETDLRSEMKRICCPNLHIFGQLDTIVPVKTAECVAGLNDNIRCEVIKRTGHLPFLTHTDEFLRLLFAHDLEANGLSKN